MSGKMNGPQKTAMLLMSLGEEAASQLLKFMTPDEIKQVGVHMTAISAVKREMANELLSSFIASMGQETDIMVQGKSFLKNLLPDVLGSDAGNMLSKIELEREKIPFKYIQDIDAKVLANFIKAEHPQTITIIMAHLNRERASQVLHYLPESLQYEVVERISQLEIVPPDLVREVDEVLEKELLSMGKEGHRILGGIPAVAEIMNVCDKRTGNSILQLMEERDAELAEKVRKLMFVFEDLVSIADTGIRELLKEVRNEELTLALKTASDDLKDKLFKNLSRRASEMLQEDMAVMGPVRLSDVEASQQAILGIARRLEKEGRIILAGSEGGDSLV